MIISLLLRMVICICRHRIFMHWLFFCIFIIIFLICILIITIVNLFILCGILFSSSNLAELEKSEKITVKEFVLRNSFVWMGKQRRRRGVLSWTCYCRSRSRWRRWFTHIDSIFTVVAMLLIALVFFFRFVVCFIVARLTRHTWWQWMRRVVWRATWVFLADETGIFVKYQFIVI